MKTTLFALMHPRSVGVCGFKPDWTYDGLPAGGQIIEVQPIQSIQHPHRALMLWMLNPSKSPGTIRMTLIPCPEYTRGSHDQGPTRVSLVDPQAKKIINTIKILNFEGDDTFDIPYRIEGWDFTIMSQGVPKGKEGKPTILWLRDYNGDGHAWEFALFDAVACMGLPTDLDRLQRGPGPGDPISRGLDRDLGKPEVHPDCLMGGLSVQQAPGSPGFWKYAIDYRGRAGTLDAYEVRYRPAEEKFYGQRISTGDDS